MYEEQVDGFLDHCESTITLWPSVRSFQKSLYPEMGSLSSIIPQLPYFSESTSTSALSHRLWHVGALPFSSRGCRHFLWFTSVTCCQRDVARVCGELVTTTAALVKWFSRSIAGLTITSGWLFEMGVCNAWHHIFGMGGRTRNIRGFCVQNEAYKVHQDERQQAILS